MLCSITKLLLLTVNPLALTHFALGGVNFNPAILPVGLKKYPMPSHSLHLLV